MQINRRKFSLLSLLGVAATALRPDWLRAQAPSAPPGLGPGPTQAPAANTPPAQDCSDLSAYQNAVSWPDSGISYWVSGFRYKQQGLDNRAILSILLKQQQTEDSYIDKIVLTADDATIVGAYYFSSQDKLSSGLLPYLIFDNLSFSSTRYFLYIQQRSSGQINRFRYTLVSASQLQRSSMTNVALPATVRTDLMNPSLNGVISSKFYFPSSVDITKHNMQTWLQSLDKTGMFSVLVKFMHDDVGPSHYMRYFIVTDPVGRILGITQRQFGQATTPAGFVTVTALTEADRNRFGLIKDDVANINDCPFVMVFCDDVSEVIMSSTLWLR